MVTNEPVRSTTSEGSGSGAAFIYKSSTHTLAAALTQDDNYNVLIPATYTHVYIIKN